MNKNNLDLLNIVVIIPARGGSKRLKDKNIYPVLGKPMINWVVEEALKSKYIDNIFVSSEINVYFFLFQFFLLQVMMNCLYDPPDIVISLQANSPSLKVSDLDGAIEFFYNNLFSKKSVCEVISVGNDNLQNACFRIMTRKTVFQKTLSTNVGVYITDCHDVHTIEDVKIAEKQILSRKC